MLRGIGVDNVEVARVERIIAAGDAFAKKVLTPREFAQYQQLAGRRQAEYLGGRFSLKEAFSKAWGTGIGREVGLQDVETLWDEKGKPATRSPKFPGKIFSSISHDKNEIVTFVALEEN